jgi:hypothetical protein
MGWDATYIHTVYCGKRLRVKTITNWKVWDSTAKYSPGIPVSRGPNYVSTHIQQ